VTQSVDDVGIKTTLVHQSVIRRAVDVLDRDERVAACWLEGSFARGTADAWSDIDLHVAVTDDSWDSFFNDRRKVVEEFGRLLGYSETSLPWGAQLVLVTIEGPARVDFYIEKVSRLSGALRLEQPLMLLDNGVSGSLQVTTNVEPLIRTRVAELSNQLFFGAMWPARLSGREEWVTLFGNALYVVTQFLIPALLIQDSPEHFFRPMFHNERFLSAERKRRVNEIVGILASSFTGIEGSGPDPAAVASAYERLLTEVWNELRAASAKYGVEYPEEMEAATRTYLRDQLRIFVE
jgi:predicted nucleotidyltransferase